MNWIAAHWIALLTASASFLGATLAQIATHLFTLRREHILRDEKADRYVEHIKFDIVLAVRLVFVRLYGKSLEGHTARLFSTLQ